MDYEVIQVWCGESAPRALRYSSCRCSTVLPWSGWPHRHPKHFIGNLLTLTRELTNTRAGWVARRTWRPRVSKPLRDEVQPVVEGLAAVGAVSRTWTRYEPAIGSIEKF